jgi:hypothetical protein
MKVRHLGINVLFYGNKKRYKVHQKYIYVPSDGLCTFDCTLYFRMYVKGYKMCVKKM